MNTYLLFPDKDWLNIPPYYDYKSIVQDLSLHILFRMASREVFWENGEVKTIGDTDPFVQETFRKVLSAPLQTEEEIQYRQAILKDCLEHEEIVKELYAIVSDILYKWDSLGRKENKRAGSRNTINGLVNDIHILNLFVTGLSEIKKNMEANAEKYTAKGLKTLRERFIEAYSDEKEAQYKQILDNISFYVDNNTQEEKKETFRRMVDIPKIVVECGISEGLKLTDMKLQEVATESKKYRDPNSTIGKVQGFINSRNPDSIQFQPETPIYNQLANMEYEIVRYLVDHCRSLIAEFGNFFDQLKLQTAFYIGGANLRQHMLRFELECCFPTVGKQDELVFEDLKEFVMCIEQRVHAVGNSCNIQDKMLLIVTGANQGGKSTFLRSIGIAQVMMQAGLLVTASKYRSGIFPNFFTHFTRREDSAMNSGRLDEELGRMNQIVENLGEDSLILLNESFATTTEKEGSVIAYDIIKALKEAGVKILTVTHLLSFAQKVYAEMEEDISAGRSTDTTFLSAERLPDGKRTFKMIQHAPELTSFGLDLYRELINNSTN